jgi:hypothetical protein
MQTNAKKQNAKIYICTHTDFDCPVTNPVYEIADSRKIFKEDKAENGMDALFYSELLTYHHLAQHPEKLPEYVGFCHYRKYFKFLDDVPDIGELVEKHGCIATNPWYLKWNVEQHYARCFCYADMDVMKAIVRCNIPWLWGSFSKMLASDNLYTCNMFIMRRADFIDVVNIVWDALDIWLEVMGKDLRRHIMEHATQYLQKRGRGSTLEHQYRIGGNLGERIVSAYISEKFPNCKTYGIHFTEDARPHRRLNVSS